MVTQAKDLWSLVLDQRYVDPRDLAAAVERESREQQLDFRTRLLIRDSLHALGHYWGKERLATWLTHCAERTKIESILHEDLGNPGFPFLREQLMEPTRPEQIERCLRDVGDHLHQTTKAAVGGSASLILLGLLSKRTQDIDFVNEVPKPVRDLGERVLHELAQLHRLELSTFQSHYLPRGWEQRVHTRAPFGRLQVSLVDGYDVFLSKLFSKREKDRGDLLSVVSKLSKETLVRRLLESGAPLLADPFLKPYAEHNWYVLFGESLPSDTSSEPQKES
jgi:hypothetical protein